jgi:hypothetical protein
MIWCYDGPLPSNLLDNANTAELEAAVRGSISSRSRGSVKLTFATDHVHHDQILSFSPRAMNAKHRSAMPEYSPQTKAVIHRQDPTNGQRVALSAISPHELSYIVDRIPDSADWRRSLLADGLLWQPAKGKQPPRIRETAVRPWIDDLRKRKHVTNMMLMLEHELRRRECFLLWDELMSADQGQAVREGKIEWD